MLNRNQVIKKLQSVNNLPTLPIVAMKLNKLLHDDDSPMEDLLELMKKDQSLVMKIMRLVNSSFFGFKNRVNSLRHAVTLLGYSTVQNAVVTVSVIDQLKLQKKLDGFDVSEFWKHSIRVAVMCKYLSAKIRLAPQDDAFTAGLLHDIGKVILASNFPDDFVSILNAMQNQGLTFSQAEQQLGSCQHPVVGGYLAKRWMLPEVLVNAIQYHHAAGHSQNHSQLIALVAFSDSLVNLMGGDLNHQLPIEKLPEETRQIISQVLKTTPDWYTDIKKDMAAASDFFNKDR